MTRLAALIAALAALLVLAPAAIAVDFEVTREDDPPPDGCAPGDCSLREAIEAANADNTAGTDDITFASGVRTITLTGLPLSVDAADGDGDDRVTISDPQGDVTVTSSDPLVDPLIEFTDDSDGSRVTRVAFTRSGGTGVEIESGAQSVVVTRSPVFGAGILPIDLRPGANGSVAAPSGLRVGPRQPDGSLPVTGSAPLGSVEFFRGDPRGSARTTFLGASDSGGSFRFDPSPELAPGTKLAATVSGATGTSEFSATATVPSDVVSPLIAGSNATSQTQVRVQPTEPISPASIALSDFTLDMAGRIRPIVSGTIIGGGQQILLNSSSEWRAGEAGYLTLNGPGAMTDQAGNANTQTSVVRVAAGPGDTVPPVITSFRISPTRMCLTKRGRCRRPGMTVTFIASEAGRGTIEALRGRSKRSKRFDVKAGRNRVKFDGRFRGRKLRAGRYQMHFTMDDVVGNTADQTPLKTFYVKRTTRRR